MTATMPRPIFSDELVNATELNRRSGRVLDMARLRPVTVARNDEFFTLIRRDEISHIVSDAAHTKQFVELITSALLPNPCLEATHPFGWLRAFDRDELQQFVTEVLAAYRKAELCAEGWEEFEAIVHEWHESAIAILSEDLADAWASPAEEMPLTPPSPEGCAT